MMKGRVFAGLCLASLLLVACKEQPQPSESEYAAVDALVDLIDIDAAGFERITEIDHSRLAHAEGVNMPPARVLIFSNPEINTQLVQLNPMVGLDLPFKVLAYSQDGEPRVSYTESEFLARRHGLESGDALEAFDQAVTDIVGDIPPEQVALPELGPVEMGWGMETLQSVYPFEETIDRLKTDIMAEGDTVWFGEVDYREEAKALGVDLPPLTLLLFGAPAPGAKAMGDFPRLGLDAFCQKILVRQLPDGSVEAYFNRIPDFAKLHYGKTAPPHRVINFRLGSTLGGAVE